MDGIHEDDGLDVNGTGTENNRGRRLKVDLVLGLLLALIIAAAFTAGHLVGDDPQMGDPQEEEFVLSNDGDIAVGMGVKLELDERLPVGEPTASGQFHHRQDNSIFISQFPMTGGVVYLDTVDEWPVMDVLVTKDTLVYKDVTDFSVSVGSGPVQQEVVPGSIDDIGKGSTLVVWGEIRGERLVADVLQYFTN